MILVLQTLVNALVVSSLFILVSLGFAFIFNMVGVFNIAHGALYMVAGYLGYLFIGSLHIPYLAGLALVIIVMAAFALLVERFGFRSFLRDFDAQILIGMALIIILTTTMNIGIGTQQFVIPRLVQGAIYIGDYSITWDKIFTIGIATVILTLVVLFVRRSRWGLQMQAISMNMEAASLQGINIHRISAIVCAVGFGLAGIAGVLMGSLYLLDPFMGQDMLVKILILTMLAGAGSFGGIFIVGGILGLIYAVFPLFLHGVTSDMAAFLLVCIILLLRPTGFFGHAVEL